MNALEQSLAKLDQNNYELQNSFVSAWALLRQNEAALAALKEAVQAFLAGQSGPVVQNMLHKVVSND